MRMGDDGFGLVGDVNGISLSGVGLEEEEVLEIPDGESVSVVEFINRRFPSEAALEAELDRFISALRRTLGGLDQELEEVVRSERHGGARSAREVAEAKQRLLEFRQELGDVQRAADRAEAAVERTSAEVRPLDTARRNIAATSSALVSLVELEEAVRTCERAIASKNLIDIGDGSGLRKISEILPKFQDLLKNGDRGLRRLPSLIARASSVRETLCQLTLSEFRTVVPLAATPSLASSERIGEMEALRLKAICVIADQLEPAIRIDIIGHFLSVRKAAYSAFFERFPAELEQSDKRFAWMRTEVHNLNANGWGGVFPIAWHVPEKVCETICAAVGHALTAQLSTRSGGKPDVDVLLLVMQRSIDFEREMDRHFGKSKRASTGDQPPHTRSELPTFVGLISSKFEKYMGVFVESEDKTLVELVDRLLREETWKVGKDSSVLASSVELFLQMKKSMRRCAALTTNKTFFDLHKVFKQHLRVYAKTLGKQVEKRFKEISSSHLTATPEEEDSLMDAFETFSSIIATAEYCATTVEQLQEAMTSQIDDAFVSQLRMSEEHDEFTAVIARGIRISVRFCENRLEPALAELMQTNWSSLKTVEDVSPYASKMMTQLRKVTSEVGVHLGPAHYRFFCERLASSILPRIYSTLFRCKTITEVGAQQLLLDLSTIKSFLVGIPQASETKSGSTGTSSVGMKTYLNMVEREAKKIEVVLKIILAPNSHVVEMYEALVPDGAAAEFQRILDLKGMSRDYSIHYVLELSKRSGESVPSSTAMLGSSLPVSRGDSVRTKTDGVHQEEGTMDSVRKLLGRFSTTDLSSQIEQTAGRLKGRFAS